MRRDLRDHFRGVNMSKILVTGGAGYLGSVLVPELLSKGHSVTVIDNFMYEQTSLLEACRSENLEIINADARDEEILSLHLKDKEFIFPLACLTGAPLCKKSPIDAKTINLGAIESIIKLRSPNQKIIFPTTNSGYGKADETGWCTEESALNPVSLYGILKNEAEEKLLEAGNVITFRLATVFGVSPRMRLDLMVNDFVYRAVNDKTITLFESHFRRNFLYIKDAINGFIFALENFERLKNNTYNLGLSSANITKMDLCHLIKEKIQDFYIVDHDFAKDPDQRDYLVSNQKIEDAGYAASTSLSSGIDELIRSYSFIKEMNFRNI